MNAPRAIESQADAIISAVRARGNEPIGSGLRDAAHEAFHALTVKAGPKLWQREKVHAKLMRKFKRAELWLHEMEARAVEQAVCKALGVDCGSVEEWVFTSSMEAIKRGLPHGEYNQSLAYVERYMASESCAKWTAKILALSTESP